MKYTMSFAPADQRGRPGPRFPHPAIEVLESRRLLSASAPAGEAPAGDGGELAAEVDGGQLTANVGQPATAEASSGAVFEPVTAAAFQQALNAAQLGDTIILQAGTTYTGWFTLPNKTTGSGWITIRSSAMDALPAEGVRVGPSDAANMPKVVSQGGNTAAIRTAAAAHHYRLIGLEIIAPADNANLWNLIELGTTGSAQNTLASVPHDIVIDRSIIRANSATQRVARGISLNSASTDILNSYIAGFKWDGFDTQAVGGWNGPGPYNIINNYLEGAGENLMFGGADPSIPGLVPADIVIRGNHFYKPLSWKIGHPSYGGIPWTVKNLLELKSARSVLIEGNIFEHNWVHGQVGYAIVLTPRNQDGGAPWTVVEDVDFVNNIVRHSAAGFNILGEDYLHPSQQTQRIRIENNLFEDIGGAEWGNGRLFQIIDRTADLIIRNNTAFHTNNIISASGGAHTGFVFTDNIVPHNSYGVHGDGMGVGNSALNTYFPGAVFTKNAIMGGNANSYNQYPGNFFPANWGQVQFEDLDGGDYRLAATSPYKDAGTNGKDIGADFGALDHATRGAISGVWSQPVEVESTEFHWQAAPHSASVRFSSNVGASLTKGHFTVQNLTTAAAVPQANWSLAYLSESNTALLTFDGYDGGTLPDGTYRLTVHADGLTGADGGTMAENYSFDFFFLLGDANRDGKVDIADLGILAGNWQQSEYGPLFGDFDYDGLVNIADLGILAGNWQVDLGVSAVAAMLSGIEPVEQMPLRVTDGITPHPAPAEPQRGRGQQQRVVVAPAWNDSRDWGSSLMNRNQQNGRSEDIFSAASTLLEDQDL
jgi:hypothetical protein